MLLCLEGRIVHNHFCKFSVSEIGCFNWGGGREGFPTRMDPLDKASLDLRDFSRLPYDGENNQFLTVSGLEKLNEDEQCQKVIIVFMMAIKHRIFFITWVHISFSTNNLLHAVA